MTATDRHFLDLDSINANELRFIVDHAKEQRQAGGKHAARSAPLAVCCGFSPRCVPVTIICPEKDGTSAKPGRILRCNHIDCADNEKVPRTTVEWL